MSKYTAGKISPLSDDEFLAQTEPDTNGGCWLWLGPVTHQGYGNYRKDSKQYLAHRESHERFCGPIPQGMFVLHSCDVRACVNPAHLRAGTHAENMDDMRRRGRAFKTSPLSSAQVKDVCESLETVEALGLKYGISPRTVSGIIRRAGHRRERVNRNRKRPGIRGLLFTETGRFRAYAGCRSLGTFDTLWEAVWAMANNPKRARRGDVYEQGVFALRRSMGAVEQVDRDLTLQETKDLIADVERIKRFIEARGYK